MYLKKFRRLLYCGYVPLSIGLQMPFEINKLNKCRSIETNSLNHPILSPILSPPVLFYGPVIVRQ